MKNQLFNSADKTHQKYSSEWKQQKMVQCTHRLYNS